MEKKLIDRIEQKLKHDLNSEEQEALVKCASAIKIHTRVGSIIGGALPIYGLYRRGMWPLTNHKMRALFFGIGGTILGMQLGLVSGSFRCIRIVRALPDSTHIVKAMREVQVELQDARKRPLDKSREWTQKSTNDEQPQENSMLKERTTMAKNTSTNSNQSTKNDGTQSTESPNVWQQIRGENAGQPETAWDRLRKKSAETAPDSKLETDIFEEPPEHASTIDTYSFPAESSSNKTPSRTKEQEEFDRLLDQERYGDTEDAGTEYNGYNNRS